MLKTERRRPRTDVLDLEAGRGRKRDDIAGGHGGRASHAGAKAGAERHEGRKEWDLRGVSRGAVLHMRLQNIVRLEPRFWIEIRSLRVANVRMRGKRG